MAPIALPHEVGFTPRLVQVTVPPGATVTVAGSNREGPSRILTVAVAGPVGSTTTVPLMGWKRQAYANVPATGNV